MWFAEVVTYNPYFESCFPNCFVIRLLIRLFFGFLSLPAGFLTFAALFEGSTTRCDVFETCLDPLCLALNAPSHLPPWGLPLPSHSQYFPDLNLADFVFVVARSGLGRLGWGGHCDA
jgi:hypothetical protein